MKPVERLRMIRKIKLSIDDSKIVKSEYKEDKMEIEPNPCWSGYEPIGLKDDGSPNCVPIKAKKVKEGFPIPSPSGDEDEQSYISRCMKEIGGEYEQEQGLAICYSKWKEK
jgi:hypothetical protein